MTQAVSRVESIEVPPPAKTAFRGGIDHPSLLLWDAWTYQHEGTTTLFTLAVARRDRAGGAVTAANRDDYPFHMRRFTSTDAGETWTDRGAYMRPSPSPSSAASHNVWSGSALPHGGGLLYGFTGVRAPAPDRRFLQSVCVVEAALDGTPPDIERATVLSDPERDHDAIRKAGYYLAARDELGGPGEEGGPILAWRDPFLMTEPGGAVRAFWSAKVAPTRPAVAHARLVRTPGGFALDGLLPPIELPDADAFTQAEVPKVYADPQGDGFLMLVSTCDRVSEDQPDEEVSKELRLYRADRLDGPWSCHTASTSVLGGARHLFGGSLIDVQPGRATLIAPYSEMAEDPDLRLTLAAPRRIDIGGAVV